MRGLILLLGAFAVSAQANALSVEREDVQKFIGKMVSEHGFEKKMLQDVFKEVEIKQGIIDAMNRPAESKPWYEYRNIFIQEKRIKGGVEFWNKNAELLKKAEKEYGVPAEIIVAIIGVETRYGRHTGGYRIIDALSTLGFEYPRRSKFFLSELEHFLIISREEGESPLNLKGSYAGAMGQPQFMPSSFRRYAVDFDGDGHRDLWANTADTIGSVANYFRKHRWQTGEAVVSRATLGKSDLSETIKKGYKPNTTVEQLEKSGVRIAPWKISVNEGADAALIELDKSEKEKEYWVGLQNFYVITRYNRSALYAMAVYQLSQAIADRRNES